MNRNYNRMRGSKWKNLWPQKTKKSLVPKETTSRIGLKKALDANTSSDEDESDKDVQLTFISKKIREMWKKRSGSN